MMKKVYTSIALMLLWTTTSSAQYAYPGYGGNANNINNQVDTTLNQNTDVIGGGASNSTSSSSSGDSTAVALSNPNAYLNFSPTYNSNYENRTPPIGLVPPYLPMWNHGGWGTVKGYFSNGPTNDDTAYESVFDPSNKEDMRTLKQLLRSAPYSGVFEAIGGIFVPTVNESKLRGFGVANAVMRDKRPDGKPIMIMIDANIDKNLLKKAGYAYVGKISVEGKATRNWDQCYGSIVANAIPWDIDVLLLSGGMKGVTVGSNSSYGAGGGMSQTNYSVSVFGSKSTGLTEGKGKPILSAECYRYNPQLAYKRNTPRQFYQMLQTRYAGVQQPTFAPPQQPIVVNNQQSRAPTQGVQRMQSNTHQGVYVNPELAQMAGMKPAPYVDYMVAGQSQN